MNKFFAGMFAVGALGLTGAVIFEAVRNSDFRAGIATTAITCLVWFLVWAFYNDKEETKPPSCMERK